MGRSYIVCIERHGSALSTKDIYKDIYSTPGLHVDIWIKLTYLQNGIYITILKIILEIILKIIIIIMIISSNNNNSTNNNDNDDNNNKNDNNDMVNGIIW